MSKLKYTFVVDSRTTSEDDLGGTSVSVVIDFLFSVYKKHRKHVIASPQYSRYITIAKYINKYGDKSKIWMVTCF